MVSRRHFLKHSLQAVAAIGGVAMFADSASAAETGPYSCWVKEGTGRDAGLLYDYYVEFRVPRGMGALARTRIQTLSWDASRCFYFSTVTPVTRSDRYYDYFTVIAGARARSAGRYWQKYAWEYGMHLRCYY